MIPAFEYPGILMDLLKGRLLRRFNRAAAPRVIAYTVTWRCNASCDMCGVKNVDNALKTKEMELAVGDISRIFKDPLLGKLDLIRFTGGEPFLKEDFTEIVEEIAKNTRTKIYYITTNGFYTDRILDFAKRLAPKTRNLAIRVSIDGPAEIHDRTRKAPGIYDRAVATLEELKKLKRSYESLPPPGKDSGFSFGINQTITPETSPYIEDIAVLCGRLGCSHNLYLAHEAHESDILEGKNLDARLRLLAAPDKDVIRALYDSIEKHRRRKKNSRNLIFSAEGIWDIVERFVLTGSKNRALVNRPFPNPPCLAMFFYFRILPDGTVMPCTLKPRPAGNLKKQSFRDIWNSKAAQALRSEVKRCGGCWVECDIVPNIMYSSGVIKEMVKKLFSLKER